VKLEAHVRQVPWRAPLRAAHGPAAETRPLVLVRIESVDGAVGYGEAAPLTEYDGVTLESVTDALALYERVLAAAAGLSHAELMADCTAVAPLPQALAAVDMALWDRAGQRAGQPVWALLGSKAAPVVELNATIGADGPLEAAAHARAAAAAGFSCIKLKVGDRDSESRVRAVRSAVGAQTRIRIDANGGWLLEDAVQTLSRLGDIGLELCEEPVHGVFAIAAVRRALPDLKIAADETAADPTLFKARICDAVCLKISRCGGITGVVRDAVSAHTAGYEVYLASTLDGPLGIAAALHVAALIEPHRPCGLATLDRFAAPEVLRVRSGLMSPPPGSGLGDRLVGWYDAL